jgi:hypothetical protein
VSRGHVALCILNSRSHSSPSRTAVLVLNQLTPRHDIWGTGCIAPPFLTSALDGSEWSASRPDRFPPVKEPWCLLSEAGSAPEPVWPLWSREKSLATAGK